MNRLSVFKLFLLSIVTAFSASAQAPAWRAATGLPGSNGSLLQASNGDFLFATTVSFYDFELRKVVFNTELYRSTDDALSFTQQGGIISTTFTVTHLSEINGDLWMAGDGLFSETDRTLFLQSSDGGNTWTPRGEDASSVFRGLAYMREVNGIYYAGGTRNYSSDDGGVTWARVGNYPHFTTINGRQFYNLGNDLAISDDDGVTQTVVFPQGGPIGSNIFEYQGRIVKPTGESTDNGLTWTAGPPLIGYTNPALINVFSFEDRIIGNAFDNAVTGGGRKIVHREGNGPWGEIAFGGSVDNPNIGNLVQVGDRLITQIGGEVHSLELGGTTGAPVIKNQPLGKTISLGERFVLSVYATGARPLSYQWYEGTPGDTSAPIAGATGSTFATAPLNAPLDFWVRISNPEGTLDSVGATANAQEIWEQLEVVPGSTLSRALPPIVVGTELKIIDQNTNLMHTSTDNGETWDAGIAWSNGLPSTGLAFVTYEAGLFQAVFNSFGDVSDYWTSPDGINWTATAGNLPGQQAPTGLARQGDTILVSLQDISRDGTNWMARSLDGGATFSLATNGLQSTPKEVQFLDNGNLVALNGGLGAALVTSSDNGTTWIQRQIVPGGKGEFVTDLFNDGVDLFVTLRKPNNIYENKGLFKSSDGGATWTQVAYPDTDLNFVTKVEGNLVVGTDASPPAFSISEDNGATFSPLSTAGLQAFTFTSTVVSGPNLFLHARSIFRLRVGETETGEPPVIVTQPTSVIVDPGERATLSVEVSGEGPFTYQWFRFFVPVGTNSSTHVVDPITDGFESYSVTITNGFGEPVQSEVANVSLRAVPTIVNDLKPAAYFVGTTRSYGPAFSFDTPASTTFQWYRGDAGDLSNPIAGATERTISNTNFIPGEKVWLRATDGAFTADSSAVAFTVLTCDPISIDLISRDPDGRTWDEGANSHLSEQGNFVLMGTPDPGESTARFPLPYDGFTTLATHGHSGGGTPNDTGNDGRFHLFGNGTVYDFQTQTTSDTFNSAFNIVGDNAEQIGTSGRYVLMRSNDGDYLPSDTNGRVDLILHDRATGTFSGLTSPNNESIGATLPAEMTEAEDEVFFSHFATDLLVEGETGNLYVYDIASDSLNVPPPVQGKGAWSMFLDASSNGRFLLFMWNPQVVPLRDSEGPDFLSPRQYLYVYDRVDDELSFLETPIPAEFTDNHTISNDGQTVSFRDWRVNILRPYLAKRVPGEDLWAVKPLLPDSLPDGNTADLQMSDDGTRFIYNTLLWSLQTPQYSTGSGGEGNVGNVMFIQAGDATIFNPASFTDWATTELSSLPLADQAANADPDGDGIINYFEFLAGNSPTSANESLLKKGPAGTVTYRERRDAPVRFNPQVSADLTTWTPAQQTRIEVAPNLWEVTLTSTTPSAFFRLSAPIPNN